MNVGSLVGEVLCGCGGGGVGAAHQALVEKGMDQNNSENLVVVVQWLC